MVRVADPFGEGPPRLGPDTRREWYRFTKTGICEVCDRRAMRTAHHVVLQQIVKREGGNVWAVSNRLLICQPCHEAHHHGGRRIPLDRVPVEAWQFAEALLGRQAARNYFTRRYVLPGKKRGA